MKVGDKVAVSVFGTTSVITGEVVEWNGSYKAEIKYFLPGSFYPRYCRRWPSEVIVLSDNVSKGELNDNKN